MMRRSLLILVIVVVMLTAAGDALAGTYVSLSGRFRIAYPDDWYQIDYRTLDYYLSRGGRIPVATQCEAAFAPQSSNPWNVGAYVMLTVDTIGQMSPVRADSIVASMASAVDQKVNRTPAAASYDAQWRPVEVTYWSDAQISAVSLEPKVERGDHVRSQIVLKFYNRGAANFYFYAPDSLWTQSQPAFASVIASFSTENLEAALPKEKLEVAKAEDLKEHSGSSHTTPVAVSGGVVVVLIAIIASRRRRARQSKSSQM